VWGIEERQWGDAVRRRMMMFWGYAREYTDVRGRGLGMEGITEGRESAWKIFEMGARSGQRNARLHSLGRVQEELAESERGKESGKVWGQNEWKGRVPDTNGILERKVKEHGEDGERERNTTRRTGMPVKMWKDWEQRKMDKSRAE
jgi:hypothetical protein